MSSFLGGGGAAVTGSKLATGNVDFYVATTGSDSNPGTITKPFATIQHAINVAALFDWVTAPGAPFAPTIHVANGTYTLTADISISGFDTMPTGTIIGNAATPANVVIVNSVGVYTFHGFGFATWAVQGFRIQPAERACRAENFFQFQVDDITLDVQFKGFQSISGGKVFLGLNSVGTGLTINSAGSPNALIEVAGAGTFSYQGFPVNFANAITFSFAVVTITGSSAGGLPGNNNGNLTGAANVSGTQYIVGGQSTYDLGGLGDRSNAVGTVVGSLTIDSSLIQDPAYQIFTPANGATITPTPGNHQIILNPASGLTSLTVKLPTFMSDAETTTLASTQAISGLVLTTTDGTSIKNLPAALTMGWGSRITLMLDRPTLTWYPAASVLH